MHLKIFVIFNIFHHKNTVGHSWTVLAPPTNKLGRFSGGNPAQLSCRDIAMTPQLGTDLNLNTADHPLSWIMIRSARIFPSSFTLSLVTTNHLFSSCSKLFIHSLVIGTAQKKTGR